MQRIKNKFSIIILAIISIFFVIISCKKQCADSVNRIGNKKAVEYFLDVDNDIGFNDLNLRLFANTVIGNFKDSKFPIKSIVKKIHVDKETQYIAIVFICYISETKSIIQFSKYDGKKLIFRNYIVNTAEIVDGFIGVCDDRYFRIKSEDPFSFSNYSYAFTSRDKLFFINIIEDSLGVNLDKVKGKCDSGLIKRNISFINVLINSSR